MPAPLRDRRCRSNSRNTPPGLDRSPAPVVVLLAAAAISTLGLFGGCESGGSRPSSDRQASSSGFDPGASEWGRRGPRRQSLPDPEPVVEETPAVLVYTFEEDSAATTESTAILVAEESVSTDEAATSAESVPTEEPVAADAQAAVVESDDGWIGDDLLGGGEETVVVVSEEDPAAEPTTSREASPPPPNTREELTDVLSEPVREAPRADPPAPAVVVVAPRPEPPPAPVPVSDAERAMAILRQAARNPDPSIRANAIESLLASPGTLEEIVTAGLVDSNRGVRFVAAMCIGRARLSSLSHLVEPLVRDSSPSVRAAAIYALRRCGRPADPTVLAAMLRSDDPEIRSNAFAVLGELGDRSAAPMIREALGKGMRRVNPIRVRIVELQGAETLVRLGSEEDIEAIRAALFAPVEQGELSILACQILARVGDQSSVPMLERLVMASGTSARPPEIRLAAAQAIAELGARTQLDLLGLAANAARSPDPLVRMQAASLLGHLGGSAAESSLATLLSDPVESVRVTAAGNLLRLAAESASSSPARPMR